MEDKKSKYSRGSGYVRPGNYFTDIFCSNFFFRDVDYYCYCEIGFTTRTIGGEHLETRLTRCCLAEGMNVVDHIITFAREGYQDFGCDVFV